MENNKNKKSVKFQGDMLNFCDFIQVYVFTRNHHLNDLICCQRVNCSLWMQNEFTGSQIFYQKQENIIRGMNQRENIIIYFNTRVVNNYVV